MKVEAARTATHHRDDGMVTLHLSDAGGLRQFGAYHETLPPGVTSSKRHWHTSEDEMLYVLTGVATLMDDDGAHALGPGEAACWRHGDPNAHHVINQSDEALTYLIIGARVAHDICHYPDHGSRQVNHATTWALLDHDGTTLRAGDLPPSQSDLAPLWGSPFDPATPALRILNVPGPWVFEPAPTHPILGNGPGPYAYLLLSDVGALSQFGAFIEELPPGSASGHRHWHETEDEMVYILSGDAVLVEDEETPLGPGDTACWPAGTPIGHRLDNRSDAPVRYLVIGTRLTRDVVHYTDHDLITHVDGPARRYVRRDGREYTDRREK